MVQVSAGVVLPCLKSGIGIALLDSHGLKPGTKVIIRCIDGEYHGELAELPLYDKACEIPRGKLVDIS